MSSCLTEPAPHFPVHTHGANVAPPARALPKVEDGAWSPLSLEEQSARSLPLYKRMHAHNRIGVIVLCGPAICASLVWKSPKCVSKFQNFLLET